MCFNNPNNSDNSTIKKLYLLVQLQLKQKTSMKRKLDNKPSSKLIKYSETNIGSIENKGN